MKQRRLVDGRTVTVRNNSGIRKRCGCPRSAWPTCPHSWAFSFCFQKTQYRLRLDDYAPTHIVTKAAARARADEIRAAIRNGTFRAVQVATGAGTPADLTFEQLGALWIERARTGKVKDVKNDVGHLRRLGEVELSPG
jgi:hypothetical protein